MLRKLASMSGEVFFGADGALALNLAAFPKKSNLNFKGLETARAAMHKGK